MIPDEQFFKAYFATPLPPPPEVDTWMESEKSRDFEGLHIAYLNGVGVIESDKKRTELKKRVANHPRRKEIIFDFVAPRVRA